MRRELRWTKRGLVIVALVAALHTGSAKGALDTLVVGSLNDQGQADHETMSFDPNNYTRSIFSSLPGGASTSTYTSPVSVTISGHKDGSNFTITGLMNITEKFSIDGDVGVFEWQGQPQSDPYIAGYHWGPDVIYYTANLATNTSLATGVAFLADRSIPADPPQWNASHVVYPFSGPPAMDTTEYLTALTFTPEPGGSIVLAVATAGLLSRRRRARAGVAGKHQFGNSDLRLK